MPREKAGILAYRKKNKKIQILLVHPGGPHYEKRDKGFWSLPKGGVKSGESEKEGAKREFKEETGKNPPKKLESLGISHKYPNCLVFVGKLPGISAKDMTSNIFTLHWKGKKRKYPEIDNHKWVDLDEVKKYLDSRFHPIIKEFRAYINKEGIWSPKSRKKDKKK